MLLDDLKAFIIEKGIVEEAQIKFDYDGSTGENTVVLRSNGSLPCDLARRSMVQISVKNADLEASRLICNEVFNAFCPEEIFQKSILINGKRMHIISDKDPHFLEKDASGRYCTVFNITVTH